jgi:hypothetical protein
MIQTYTRYTALLKQAAEHIHCQIGLLYVYIFHQGEEKKWHVMSLSLHPFVRLSFSFVVCALPTAPSPNDNQTELSILLCCCSSRGRSISD